MQPNHPDGHFYALGKPFTINGSGPFFNVYRNEIEHMWAASTREIANMGLAHLLPESTQAEEPKPCGDDWTCECGYFNQGLRSKCRNNACLRPRPDLREKSTPPPEPSEFPALIVHCVNGKPAAYDILQGDGDLWSKTYPMGQPNVTTHVLPIELLLRARKMEAALECVYAEYMALKPDWKSDSFKLIQSMMKEALP